MFSQNVISYKLKIHNIRKKSVFIKFGFRILSDYQAF